MLKQTLQKLYENDETAASNSGSDRIKAEVLSRIESERSMRKHFGIKPLIVAAAVMAVGLTTAVLTVSASEDKKALKTSRTSAWTDQFRDSVLEIYDGDEEAVKRLEEHVRRSDVADMYYTGKAVESFDIEKITAEKELDSSDTIGYVEPYRIITNYAWADEKSEEAAMQLIRQLEEAPESLGLVPIGKSEMFEGGLRIVNRHFENTNEPADGWKEYYSLRRVYTDDAENRLLASMYYVESISFPDDENLFAPDIIHPINEGNQTTILHVFFDHTEEGCLYGFDKNKGFDVNLAGTNRREYDDNGKAIYSLICEEYRLKSNAGENGEVVPVTVGTSIAVRNDWVQILD